MDIAPSADTIFDQPFDLTSEELDIIYADFEQAKQLYGLPPWPAPVLREVEHYVNERVLQRRIHTLRGMLSSALRLLYAAQVER